MAFASDFHAGPATHHGVLGNHDLLTDDGHIVRRLETVGVRVLVNRNCSLPPPFERVSICGVDGGQVALPDGTAILDAGGPLARVYGRGRFEIAGKGTLIVSRGVGCSNLPIRINSDPELIICRLVGS